MASILGSIVSGLAKAATNYAQNKTSTTNKSSTSSTSNKTTTTTNKSSGTSSSGNTIKVDASGNAPKNTQVGTIVQTAGGNYKVVAPGTAGASYNPANGLWSVKVESGGTGNSSTIGNTSASRVSSPSSTSTTGNRTTATTTTTKPASTATTTTSTNKNQSQAGYSMPQSAQSVGVYTVGADGKAPAGLKVNDLVVTAAGTYRITGVKADGTYTSQMANQAQTTANYKGTYANATNQNRGTAAKDINNDGYITTYDATGVLGLGQLTGKTIPDDYVILQTGTSGKDFIAVPKEKERIYQSMIDRSNNGGAKISSANFENSNEVITLSEADAIAAGIPTYHSRLYGITAADLVGAQVGAGTPSKILADAGLTGTNSWTDPISNGYSWSPNSNGVVTFNGAGYDYTAPGLLSGQAASAIQVDASGNASSNTPVGTIVQTAAGNYLVVPPNTQGASYNPASDLWSIKISGPTETGGISVTPDGYYPGTGAPGTGYLSNGINNSQGTVVFPNGTEYTPTGSYFDSGMSQSDLAAINSLKQAYEAAKVRGDTAGMEAAHAQAEAIRAKYGYSGGIDGSEYHAVELPKDTLPKMGLPVYEAQVNPTNDLYNASLQAQTQALQSAYDLNRLELQKYLGEIPPIYQAQANAIAANAEKEKQAMHEMAAANGLNVGTGTQADLALSNQLQNDLGAVRTAQANAINDAQHDLTMLYVEYQNSIAQAIADNEYERAAALLSEYQRQAQSVVDVAQKQAYLNIDIAGFNRDTNQYNDAFALEQENTSYQRLLEQADTLAQFGDFSGYLALGYTQDQVNAMRAAWKAANADWAYML